jgi:hypothetical protein
MAPPQKRAARLALAQLQTAKHFFSVVVKWIASLLAAIPPAMSHITEPQFL